MNLIYQNLKKKPLNKKPLKIILNNYFLCYIIIMDTLTKKQIWTQKNKDKIAEYARNYYHKRCEKDPDYKKRMCEKEKKNKAKRHNITEIKPVGRPLKYITKNE